MRFPSLFTASADASSSFGAAVLLGLALSTTSVQAQDRTTESQEAAITGMCPFSAHVSMGLASDNMVNA